MATLLTALSNKIDSFEQEKNLIPQKRQEVLDGIANQLKSYISQQGGQTVRLLFVCTHNSRRSHISQLWGQAISRFYGFDQVQTYSGGTEATAFFPSAVQAMKTMGFAIEEPAEATNPVYHIRYAEDEAPVQVFSKVFDDASNPQANFAAIMTCGHADENCPFIPGTDLRLPLLYDDPKAFDGTPIAQQKYNEKAEEIGRELSYIFSTMKA